MMKPAQAQGRNLRASLETDSSRNVRPINRRSRIDVPPTNRMIPNICTVSMTGNNHNELRTAAPTGVFSSHAQMETIKCISLILDVHHSGWTYRVTHSLTPFLCKNI